MAYRGDFYNLLNIIGYTGDLQFYPTVYFRRGAEYGHITQHHKLGKNVGRETVRWDADYHIANHYHRGRVVNTEWRGDERFHTSRNPLITRDRFGPGDLLTLGTAIVHFPDLKLMYSARRMVQLKALVGEELKWQFEQANYHRYELFGRHADGQRRDPNPRVTAIIDRQIMQAGGRYQLLRVG